MESPVYLESSEYKGGNRILPTIKFLKETNSDLINFKTMKALEL